MGNGCIQQIGSGAELFDKPSSGYVAKFLGINSFKGKAIRTRGGFLEIEANGTLLLAPSMPNLLGKNVIATLKPENITLSKSAPTTANGSDVVNSVEGVVTEMVQMRSNAQVTVDTGFILKTRLLLGVIKNLGLCVGDNVYVNFAADSLNVFVDDGS
jgi:ABC-type Fe3+/spermidine/putrescine transport system ATPase subunit